MKTNALKEPLTICIHIVKVYVKKAKSHDQGSHYCKNQELDYVVVIKAGAASVTNITSRDGKKNKLVFSKQNQQLKKNSVQNA